MEAGEYPWNRGNYLRGMEEYLGKRGIPARNGRIPAEEGRIPAEEE